MYLKLFLLQITSKFSLKNSAEMLPNLVGGKRDFVAGDLWQVEECCFGHCGGLALCRLRSTHARSIFDIVVSMLAFILRVPS